MIRYTLILLIGLVILSSFRLLVITHMAFADLPHVIRNGHVVKMS